jgi:hypothetical protein
MTEKLATGSVRFIEESGERFAVIPEKKFAELLRRLDDLQDSLEMKKALREGGEFITLDEFDKELSKAGLI